MINPVVFQGNVVDSSGNTVSGASVSVISVDSGLPVSLYSDLSDTPISNPFNAAVDGSFVFYCESTTVNVTASKDGFSRTWENQFLNVVSATNNILENSNRYNGANSYTLTQNFQSTILVPDMVVNSVYIESDSDLQGIGSTLKCNGTKLLTEYTLSNANNIVDDDRAVTNVGWWAIAQENLRTAAFADMQESPTDLTSGRALITDSINSDGDVWGADNVLYGSNANGEYWRFPNGLQICTYIKTTTSATPTALGSLYQLSVGGWTLPISFTNSNYIVQAFTQYVTGSDPISVSNLGAAANTTSAIAGLNVIYINSVASTTTKVFLTAIGRWK